MPGFGLSMGITLTWLSLIVLIPLSSVFIVSVSDGWSAFWSAAMSDRALAADRHSFGGALIAAAVNSLLGRLVAGVRGRHQ